MADAAAHGATTRRTATIPRVSGLAGVLFDMGGVVMDSPLHAIARYERARGLPPNAINRVVAGAGEAGAWARLERGELTRRDVLHAVRGGLPRPRRGGGAGRRHGRHRRGRRAAARHAGGDPANPRARPARGRAHQQLEARGARGRRHPAPAARALRRLHRVARGRPAQARPADLHAGLPRAGRGAGAHRVPGRHRPQSQGRARARHDDDQGRRAGAGAAGAGRRCWAFALADYSSSVACCRRIALRRLRRAWACLRLRFTEGFS